MVLFLAAVGLILFFGGIAAIICEPPKGKLKFIALVIFIGTVLLGGASLVDYKEDLYRASHRVVWDSVEAIEGHSPIKIGDKWYQIKLIEIPEPDGAGQR